MKNPPSFQFYPQDFISDLNVQSMTDEEVGRYIKLLCYCWIEDGLLVKGGSRVVEQWLKQSPTVARCFVKKDGKYRNPRLDRERQKQINWREKSSKGGLHSVEKKRLLKGGSTKGQPKVNQGSTLPLPLPLYKDHKNDLIYTVLEAWNAQNIRNLKDGESKVREKTVSKIDVVLKEYPLEIIIKAIENYGQVIHHPEHYFFSYKWELHEFLQRGMRKFMDEARPFENFKIKNAGYQGPDAELPGRDVYREAYEKHKAQEGKP